MEKERLQKVLSRLGYGSRRDCEKLVAEGRICVNGILANLGDKADIESDNISVDGKIIQRPVVKPIFWAFYKPRKVLSDIKKNDDRKIVSDFLPLDPYFFIVGRLDYDSEGLILLTNNGEVANKLTHPRFEHEKEYQVLVSRSPDDRQLKAWRNGVILPNGERTKPASVEILPIEKSGVWLKIILKEGKKRQIRETGLAIGLPVKRIIRKRIGPIELGRLKSGQWRELSSSEIKKLTDLL